MQYRQLGRSGLQISALALGTMTFGGSGAFQKAGSTDVAGAERQLDLCIDAGVNFVDTANIYSRGLAEEILGQAVQAEGRRETVLIASKVRFRMGERPNDAALSRHHIIAGCEASLRRLRSSHIDLYQLHEWDGLTPLEETLEAMDTLVRSGKVRYVGVSNFSAWYLMKTIGVAREHRDILPITQQIITLCRLARRNMNWCRHRSTRVLASWSGARLPVASSPASTAAPTLLLPARDSRKPARSCHSTESRVTASWKR